MSLWSKRVQHVVTTKMLQIRLTLESAEVDTRADGAIQVVGEPSDTAADGTIEIHLVHPIEFTHGGSASV